MENLSSCTVIQDYTVIGDIRVGLSNFWIGAWFPFDAFQFNKYTYLGKWHMKKVNVMQQSMMKSALSRLVLWVGGAAFAWVLMDTPGPVAPLFKK